MNVLTITIQNTDSQSEFSIEKLLQQNTDDNLQSARTLSNNEISFTEYKDEDKKTNREKSVEYGPDASRKRGAVVPARENKPPHGRTSVEWFVANRKGIGGPFFARGEATPGRADLIRIQRMARDRNGAAFGICRCAVNIKRAAMKSSFI
ncbi:hypothetical protein GWI33_015203 [Rhynchophorus ferrugineus]|uniref:Uncharacterized protein n=1 Tax=Rhynchophorus ferrugineus TaxID=354439 RepID=A0A834HZU2_RHYFE|nr:hypothetical protein GWI33_015203 [Rhynchophorus ferrugineus]